MKRRSRKDSEDLPVMRPKEEEKPRKSMGPAVLAEQNDKKAKALFRLGWQMRPKGTAKTKAIARSTAPATVFATEIATIGASIPSARREFQPNLVGAIEYSLEARDRTFAQGSHS